MKRRTWIIGGVSGFFLILCCGLGQMLGLLLVGWLIYPVVTFAKMAVEPAALMVGCLSFVLFVPLTHSLAAWLYAHSHREQNPPPVWQIRWTAAIVGIVVLLFATGICLIVVVHQFAWLATSERPWSRSFNPRTRMQGRLLTIGQAVRDYEEEHHHFPPGGSFDRYGSPLHSWETMLLPYSEHWEYSSQKTRVNPDLSLRWNDPGNAGHFKTVLPTYLNPGVAGPSHDSEGYGLSHYAANARVLGPGRAMRKEQITDGLSNTIMAGEIKENFRPWGDPLNYRDPAEGVQQSPDGFGGPWSDGETQFLMMDGSTRQVGKDIDPAILKALATPNGGEKVPENADP
jgi:hypothetical protein